MHILLYIQPIRPNRAAGTGIPRPDDPNGDTRGAVGYFPTGRPATIAATARPTRSADHDGWTAATIARIFAFGSGRRAAADWATPARKAIPTRRAASATGDRRSPVAGSGVEYSARNAGSARNARTRADFEPTGTAVLERATAEYLRAVRSGRASRPVGLSDRYAYRTRSGTEPVYTRSARSRGPFGPVRSVRSDYGRNSARTVGRTRYRRTVPVRGIAGGTGRPRAAYGRPVGIGRPVRSVGPTRPIGKLRRGRSAVARRPDLLTHALV